MSDRLQYAVNASRLAPCSAIMGFGAKGADVVSLLRRTSWGWALLVALAVACGGQESSPTGSDVPPDAAPAAGRPADTELQPSPAGPDVPPTAAPPPAPKRGAGADRAPRRPTSPLFIDPIDAFGAPPEAFKADVAGKCEAIDQPSDCVQLVFVPDPYDESCTVTGTEPDVKGKRVEVGTTLKVLLSCESEPANSEQAPAPTEEPG